MSFLVKKTPNKLVIIHTTVIKLKENVTMHLVCLLTEWKSQSSKKERIFFFFED